MKFRLRWFLLSQEVYYKNNFYNFRRVLKGPAFLKLRKLTYYITQDIKFIILDKKTP